MRQPAATGPVDEDLFVTVAQHQDTSPGVLEQRERMRCFRDVVAHPTWSIERQIEETLRVGCDRLCLETGLVARAISETRIEVLYRFPSDDEDGAAGDLRRRLCAHAFRAGRTLALDHASASPWRREPAVAEHHLEAYFGVPIRVAGRAFGSLCFFSREPRVRPFRACDFEYVELLGCWLGTMIERREAEQLRGRFIEEVMAAQERERQRIARELHDLAGQNLIGVLFRLRTLEASLPAAAAAEAETIRALIKDTLEDLKRLARGLHPIALDDLGLAPALSRLVAEIAEAHPLEVELDLGRRTSADPEEMPPAVAQAVYRIVQEGLTNVVKHAGARRARVELTGDGPWFRLTIEDDGCGFDDVLAESAARGLGLHGIRERLSQLGGTLAIEARPEAGARLVAKFPVRPLSRSSRP